MKLLRLAVMTLTVATAAIACKEPTTPTPSPPPPPGSAIVSLVTPNTDDGAIVVRVQGPGLSTLQSASSGYLFYSRLAGERDARVIVLGDVTAGAIFTFKVAAGSSASAYTATIEQVVSRGDALRPSLSNYSLTLTAAP